MKSIIDKTLEQMSAHFGLAGAAMLVVKEGRTALKYCWGLADVTTGRPVTETCYFDIASNSKAFTTMMTAQLCDEGKLDWDTPVRKWWPDFAMADKFASERMTARDMACHRTGLCSHDMLSRQTAEELPSRAALVERVKHLPLAWDFRSHYHYQNQMYTCLGYLGELVDGRTWEEMIRARIAEPLGMDVEFRGLADMRDKEQAMPHRNAGGKTVPSRFSTVWTGNPCGGIKTNLRSMEKWLHTLIRGGVMENGERLVSEQQFQNLITPCIIRPDTWNPYEPINTYALAWMCSVYKGHKLVCHSGSVSGFNSHVGFFPEENCGYVILTNCANTNLPDLMHYVLSDLALGIEEQDYGDLIALLPALQPKAPKAEEPAAMTPTAGDLVNIPGRYWHPGYHNLYIELSGGTLTARLGITQARLIKIAPDRFCGKFEGSDSTADFRFSEDGQTLTVNFTPNVAECPFVYKKKD